MCMGKRLKKAKEHHSSIWTPMDARCWPQAHTHILPSFFNVLKHLDGNLMLHLTLFYQQHTHTHTHAHTHTHTQGHASSFTHKAQILGVSVLCHMLVWITYLSAESTYSLVIWFVSGKLCYITRLRCETFLRLLCHMLVWITCPWVCRIPYASLDHLPMSV